MKQQTIQKQMRLFILIVSFVSISSLCESCSTVSVRALQSSKADDTYRKTVYALWWGGSDPIETVDCGDGKGLHIVSSSSNWLYSLCTVVTFGAVVPMDIVYRCTSENLQNGGTLE